MHPCWRRTLRGRSLRKPASSSIMQSFAALEPANRWASWVRPERSSFRKRMGRPPERLSPKIFPACGANGRAEWQARRMGRRRRCGSATRTDGTSGAAGMYFPQGTGGNPYALVKGRPVVVAEQSPLLGALGDILLADLSQYAIVLAALKADLSLHLRFDVDEGVFAFVWRGMGMPAWSSPVTPFNGGAPALPVCHLGGAVSAAVWSISDQEHKMTIEEAGLKDSGA